MLAVLENILHGVVEDTVDSTVQIFCGPGGRHGTGSEKTLEILVYGLTAAIPLNGDEVLAARERAWLTHIRSWDTNGRKNNFSLPDDAQGEIVLVESPPGQVVNPGDDYFIEDRILRFYHPPPEGRLGVTATLREGPARGYSESRPCRMSVNLTVSAKKLKDADAVFAKSFNAVLASFADMGNLRSAPDDSGVTMQFVKPAAILESIQRAGEKAGKKTDQSLFYQVTAIIAVLGELRISIALGAEEPESRIKEIHYQTNPIKKAMDASSLK